MINAFGRRMKNMLTIMLAIMMISICQHASADGKKVAESPAVQLLESRRDMKGIKDMKLEGFMLKMAKGAMKKSPVVAISDNLDRMYIFAIEDASEMDEVHFRADAEKVLAGYTKVAEVVEDHATTILYINGQVGDTFNEMIMYVTRPGTSMMIFQGEFTTDHLVKMNEISERQRKERKTTKR